MKFLVSCWYFVIFTLLESNTQVRAMPSSTSKQSTYAISGVKCQSCVGTIKTLLAPLDRHVDILPDRRNLVIDSSISVQEVNALLKSHPFRVSPPSITTTIKQVLVAYKPLLGALAGVTFGSLCLQLFSIHWNSKKFLDDFMGLFLVAFSSLKLVNLKGFVNTFAAYDIPTIKFRPYGYLYPFIELALGLWMLFPKSSRLPNWPFLQSTHAAHYLTIALLSVSSTGVYKAISTPQRQKAPIKCACMGTLFDLPMTGVSFFENFFMIALAIISLFLK